MPYDRNSYNYLADMLIASKVCIPREHTATFNTETGEYKPDKISEKVYRELAKDFGGFRNKNVEDDNLMNLMIVNDWAMCGNKVCFSIHPALFAAGLDKMTNKSLMNIKFTKDYLENFPVLSIYFDFDLFPYCYNSEDDFIAIRGIFFNSIRLPDGNAAIMASAVLLHPGIRGIENAYASFILKKNKTLKTAIKESAIKRDYHTDMWKIVLPVFFMAIHGAESPSCKLKKVKIPKSKRPICQVGDEAHLCNINLYEIAFDKRAHEELERTGQLELYNSARNIEEVMGLEDFQEKLPITFVQ